VVVSIRSVWLLVLVGSVWLVGCSGKPDRGWTQENGYRWRAVSPSAFFGQTGFQQLSPSQTGVAFENTLTRESIARNRNYTNGSGVAVGDVNGDGWADLYFGQMDGPNRLYLNEGGGDIAFREATESAGIAHENVYTTGVALADVDGDGDLDLLVGTMSNGLALYHNDGTGQFKRATNSGLDTTGTGTTTLTLADIDGDSDLDLYVTNYREQTVEDLYDPSERTFKKTVQKTGENADEPYKLISPFDEYYDLFYPRQSPDRREVGEQDALYLNDGDGTFTKVTDVEERFQTHDGAPKGLEEDWGLAAKFQDLNDDGWPDLYVCNDFWTPDRVWINQRDGTFRAAGPHVMRNFSFSSMAVDFSDLDADGHLDFFVTEMLGAKRKNRARQQVSFDPVDPEAVQYMRNSLYVGRSDDTFAEITYFSDTEATGWSWGTRFLDVDLDGYEDLLVNTGHTHDVLDLDTQREVARRVQNDASVEKNLIFQYPSLPLANQALKNEGDRTFTETSTEWGFSGKDISHGLATGDFDRDGDLDLVRTRLEDPAALYRNTATQPRIAVRLRGTPHNTRAIGATIRLTGGPVPQTRQMEAGGDYLSSSAPMVVFAARTDASHRLTVTWPDGTTTTVDTVRANRVYEVEQQLVENSGPPNTSNATDTGSVQTPIFKDVSGRLDHQHTESSYDDFRYQKLLPLKLSRLGPGVSWLNMDGEGSADLFIGSGKGGQLGIRENQGDTQLTPRTGGPLTEPAPGDQTTILGWHANDALHAVVGLSNYEQLSEGSVSTSEAASMPSALHYRIEGTDTTLVQEFQGILSTTGPLAAADYTGNGRLDLFVGGRVKPTSYPESARSRLYTNQGGTFQVDLANPEMGLVTGAVFVDYDGDGDQDLLASRAWDSLVLLENENGRFRNVSGEVGLADHKGWWNGVATGDFNNDGRPDVIATNWGLNSRYQLEDGRPLKMFYEDFDGDRRPEIIESHYEPEVQGYVPYGPLTNFARTIPSLRQRVGSHTEYATATVTEIAGRPLEALSSKEVTTLRHTLFLNTEDGFVARPLPLRAQYAPAFYAGVADYDNDGNEDLFLSQNLFALPKLVPRQDAGRGLWLRGDGTGHFTPIGGSRSGVKVYGEQRGAALGDVNRDGRVDLAVSQNGGPTKLYQNQTSERGLRVVLRGPPENQDAFGASLRIVYADDSKGPRRSVQAGSGYWSQNSAVQVLGMAKEPSRLEVAWPGGKQKTVALEPDQHRVVVRHAHAWTDSIERDK